MNSGEGAIGVSSTLGAAGATFTTEATLGIRTAAGAAFDVRTEVTEAAEGCEEAMAGRVAAGEAEPPAPLPLEPTVVHAPPTANVGAGA